MSQLVIEPLEPRALLDAGFFDPSFGTAGIASTHFDGFAIGSVVQNDGRIVIAGVDAILARFLPDGTSDTSFGQGGEATAPALGQAIGMAIQGDGRIIVAGFSNFTAARFNSDGSLDTSFGNGGIVSHMVNSGGDVDTSVLLQPDGKIVMVGYHHYSGPGLNFSTTELVRYNSDGTLDSSFGSGGQVHSYSGTPGTAALQVDGRIVVAETSGATFSLPFLTAWFLTRYNPDGSRDTAFTPTIDFGIGANQGIGVAIQRDGKIVTTGYAGHPAMARVNADGSMDTTFGVGGKVLTTLSGNVSVASDGSILIAGYSYPTSTTGGVLRYLADGCLDVRFGDVGQAIPATSGILASSITLQADGSIFVTGRADGSTTSGSEMAVGRYHGGGSAALTGTLNERFVKQVYLDLLGRPAENDGLTFWSGLLDEKRTTRDQVVLGIEHSSEYDTLIVESLYARYFHRQADESGLTSWTGFLASGGSFDQLRAILLGSEEYALSHAGSTGTATFMSGVYKDVLLRWPDPTGGAFWTQAISSGISNQIIAGEIIRSPEGASDEVQNIYHALLHRAPDPSGFDSFTSMLRAGISTDVVVADVAGSDEYLAQV